MHRLVYVSLLAPIAITGCSSSSTSSSDQPVTTAEYDDTAQAVGTTTIGGGGDLGTMTDVITLSGGDTIGFTLEADGSLHDSRLGLDFDYTLTCTDAAGANLPHCGDATDHADATLAIAGNLTTAAVDASLTRNGHWTASGLQSDRATFDGTGNFNATTTIRSVFRPGQVSTYALAYDGTYQAIVLDTATHDALSGSAAFDITAHHTETGSAASDFAVHGELAFHADHTGTLTLDGDQVYTIDARTGIVVRAN